MSRRRRTAAPRDEPRSERSPRAELALAALVLAVAAATRLAALGREPLWVDEAMSWRFASMAPAELLAALRLDSGPPLYYLVLRAWTAVSGDGEAALRVPSALAGVALVAAIWRVGRRRLGAATGLAAAAAAAISPVAISFSREARVYPLLSLAALLAVVSASRWLASRRRAALAAAWLAAAAAFYLHNYGLLLVPVLVCLPWLVRNEGVARQLRDGALLAVPVTALVPWLPTLAAQLRAGAPTSWMTTAWEAQGGALGSLAASLASLSPGGSQPPYVGIGGFAAAGRMPEALALAALLAGTLTVLRRDGSASTMHGRWLVAFLTLPLAGAVAISLLGPPIYLPGRLDQLVLAPYCLLVGAGLVHLRPRALAALAGSAWIVLATATVVRHLSAAPAPDRADLGAAARQIAETGTPLTIVCTSLTRAPLEHALRAIDGVRWLSFPAELAEHPGNVDPDGLLADEPALRREAESLVRALDGRVLLAFVADPVGRILLDRLLADPRPRRSRDTGAFRLPRLGLEVRLFLLDLPPDSP